MPHTQSAKKRLRQSEERRIRNKDRLTEVKTIRKRILRAVNDGQKQEAETLYRELTQRLDQAASTNTIHRNSASRTKSRIAKAIAAGKPAATKSASAKPKSSAPKSAAPPSAVVK
ncbi:MAG: 30S ribosomal protein S20 [Planctomycetes bacterium]|nr:30S ribosomal protein S20 [Planctomycetota bacterium]